MFATTNAATQLASDNTSRTTPRMVLMMTDATRMKMVR
jgi:hypothetical protein